MPYILDPEISAALAADPERSSVGRHQPRGDWRSLRQAVTAVVARTTLTVEPFRDVEITSFAIKRSDGAQIELRWYRKAQGVDGPAVVYAHGSGMIMLNASDYDPYVSEYTSVTGVPFLSVDYRLAPEMNGTALVEDVYAGLSWLVAESQHLGVDRGRIAVMGDSAGGGIAAGVAIAARDRGIALAKQILIYPMLDDRTTKPDPNLEEHATWTFDNNFTGWSALLGNDLGGPTVSPLAAPARLTDFRGLAPTYLEVGELDIFRDEDIRYAQGIAAAGISLELHVHPGAPHGFDRLAPQSRLAQRALADRFRVIRNL